MLRTCDNYLRLVFMLAAGWLLVPRKARAERCSALSWMLFEDASLVSSSRINWIWRSCVGDVQVQNKWEALSNPLLLTNKSQQLIPRTNFSHSASAFCRRRISTSTWLRACFSLTSKAPLSVSLLVSTSLQDPRSCWVLSHLRRHSSKLCAIWMKPGRPREQTILESWLVSAWEPKGCHKDWKPRAVNYSLGSTLSLRMSTCVFSWSYKPWRLTTAVSMVCSFFFRC